MPETKQSFKVTGETSSTVQCTTAVWKRGHYAGNCPKPRVRDSKYFMEQMLLAKQDKAGVILTGEQNDFLFADALRMEENEELSANGHIKEMKDVLSLTESELYELEKAKDFFERSTFGNKLQARIKFPEKDVQRCQKQNVDLELQLQHEKEKHKWDSTSKNKNTNPLDYSWISKLEKLENENVSLYFKVQSLIKERDNVKLEYQKLFDSIKKTRSQTQKEMDELIVHVSEKTYAYGAIRAENQNFYLPYLS
ncbi:hypothetical protein Tco_0053585 [Tanacetum coccineum]